MAKNKFSYRGVSDLDVHNSKSKCRFVYFIVKNNKYVRFLGLFLVGGGIIIAALSSPDAEMGILPAVILVAGGVTYGIGVAWTYFFLK